MLSFLLIPSFLYAFDGLPYAGPDKEMQRDESVLSFTLDQAIERALEANRNMLSSHYAVRNDELSLRLSRSFFDVRLVPSGSLGASGGEDTQRTYGVGVSFEKRFSYGTRASIGPRFFKSGDFYSSSVDLTVEQPLLRGLGKDVNLDGIRSAEFSLRNAHRNLYQTRVNTILDTVSGVYEVIKQKELVRLYAALADRVRGHAEAAKVKEKSGLATSMDVYRAEIRLKDFEDNLLNAKEALQDAMDRLKTILALPVETGIDISAPLVYEPVEMGQEEAMDAALKNRVDFARIMDELNEVRRKSEIANRNILPGISLLANYSRFGAEDSFRSSARLDNDRWNLLLVSSTSLPLTAEKTAYLQSLNTIETTRLRLEAKQDEVKREVRKQLSSLKKLEERIGLRRKQISQAEGKLALAGVKFAHDLADNFDIIESETELQQARVNLLSAEIDYIIGTYTLRSVLGTLISYDNETPRL